MNTVENNLENTVESSFQANPLGVGIGAGLALTATFGILAAYMFGAGDRPRYWMTIAIFFVAASIVSYLIARIRQN